MSHHSRSSDTERLGENPLGNVVLAALSLAVASFGYGGITSYVALFSQERGIRPESLFFTVFALSTIVIRVFTSRLGDRFGAERREDRVAQHDVHFGHFEEFLQP